MFDAILNHNVFYPRGGIHGESIDIHALPAWASQAAAAYLPFSRLLPVEFQLSYDEGTAAHCLCDRGYSPNDWDGDNQLRRCGGKLDLIGIRRRLSTECPEDRAFHPQRHPAELCLLETEWDIPRQVFQCSGRDGQ